MEKDVSKIDSYKVTFQTIAYGEVSADDVEARAEKVDDGCDDSMSSKQNSLSLSDSLEPSVDQADVGEAACA